MYVVYKLSLCAVNAMITGENWFVNVTLETVI